MSKKNIDRIKRIAIPILKKNGVRKAGIFGSAARGELKKTSDIDFLIQFEGRSKSLLDLVGLELELKDALGREVDVITYKYIHPKIKKKILSEEVRIL